MHRIPTALVALTPFGILYFALATAFGVEEVRTALSRLAARLRRRRT